MISLLLIKGKAYNDVLYKRNEKFDVVEGVVLIFVYKVCMI